ncbi:diguanylate cyclase domain-containing protein [Pseudomonas chlororaphis]|uniref:diguanylate cyclase domain-containing protein n=1 Tax=Pseudomonas chlororaphis TaxID=587753 RepID=UPI0009D77EE6|nr:diguanylate cyclase [Pseudomonas chlororaphis]
MTPYQLGLGAALALLLVGALLHREHVARRQLKRYRTLLEGLPDSVLVVDAAGTVRQHNTAARKLLAPASQARTDNLLAGTSLAHWLPDLDPACAAGRHPRVRVVRNGGELLSLDLTCLPAPQGGERLLLIHPAPAPTGQLDDAERYKRSQYFARIGTWDWDVGTEKLFWSEAIYGMFGFKVGEVVPSYELFCSCVHPDDRAKVRAGEVRCLETGQNHDEEYRVIWPDGSVHWLRETGNVVKNVHDTTVKMMGVVRDITEERNSVHQLHHLAHFDTLTGLPNRLVLEDRLSRALEQARLNDTRVALVFVDLNGFKAINDRYGHAAGDRVLATTAKRLQNMLRVSDTVARIGGDEFVVILEGLPGGKSLQDEAHAICKKIFLELAPPVTIGGDQHSIGSSLGVAVFPDHAPSMDKLIHIADLAMYEAKRSGNNQYRLGR